MKKQAQQQSIVGYGFWNTTETYQKHSASCCEQVLAEFNKFCSQHDLTNIPIKSVTEQKAYDTYAANDIKENAASNSYETKCMLSSKDFTIIPWCNEQQNAQLLQDELTCKTRLCELKEADQRASRVKARAAKWREIQEWQEQCPQAKEVSGSRMPGTGHCEMGQNSLEPKLS